MTSKFTNQSVASDDHDEGYFASFTDLLVGILFIFIIMLMIFATNYQQKTKQTEDSAKVFTKIKEARDQMLVEMQKALQSEGVKVSIDVKSGVLRLPESLLFESGKWEPNDRGVVALKKLARVMMDYLPCLASTDLGLKKTCSTFTLNESVIETVLIEGHTDSKPFRSEKGFDSNWGLSARRSISIFDLLSGEKPELKNILNTDGLPVLGVSGYADTRPISQKSLLQNRRIDIRFIMRSPTPEEIEKIKHAVESR